ncbi:bile acyl-CoA synthetase isoform X2 [Alligator sinensis]|uniref:long-chain-fatty-acid--CoA ligase n=1 Tax=Alligator sinensis TaxID=38654 RepID=A0A3Q0GXK3_ALLSI|nr:bile acyl-CoA synthetase isoform X2 [Alligator sinensis]
MFLLFIALTGLLLLLPLLGIFFPYWWQDLTMCVATIRLGVRCLVCFIRRPAFTMLDMFLEKVRRHPKKPLLLFGDQVFTYQDIDRLSSKTARVLQGSLGLTEGDSVAVFLMNIPAYVWVWLGLAKIGCAMACLNYNIRSQSLLYSLVSCGTKVLLTSPDLKAAIEEILPSLQEKRIRVYYLSAESPTQGVEALQGQIESASAEPLPVDLRAKVSEKSTSVYIYTSGTTGATCVLRPKFSVSQFWDDCRRYHVTVIQYVGEVMRYLCNAPKRENERNHNVRLALGNGMRVEVWKEFLQRFGPVCICEFYGATEGNSGFVNYTGKIGSVGRDNPFLKKLAPYELIKYDVERDEPVRDERGYCIRVPTGEAGLLVTKITKAAPFSGYVGDQKKTEKKILRDVLKKGDLYFNSGDLLSIDHEGFVYFQDRVGDTFRWKGENVATTEVETTLAAMKFIQEVNVYGVPVPGHEGKIGMAAIRLTDSMAFEGEALYTHTKDYLPSYAIPRFVRLQDAMEITGTFKQCKGRLVKEGFDPTIIKDRLFFLDESKKCYVPMSHEMYKAILDKKLKL